MDFIWKTGPGAMKERSVPLKDGSVLQLLYFPMLQQTGLVRHCFTTRQGGVSTGMFSSLNLSFSRGDKREAVEENFRRLSEALDVSKEQFVFSDQTHTTRVRRVIKGDAGNGLTREKSFFDTDGLITDEPGLMLSTFYADCVPLFFVDPVHRAIGLSHSGWRGTVGRMGKVTLEMMHKQYKTNPSQVFAAIGPSICQDCYEVSGDVIERFKETFDEALWSELFYEKAGGKYQLDLWRANLAVLTEAGIPKEQIAVTNVCTHCNPEILFSHRSLGTARGNLSAFLALK